MRKATASTLKLERHPELHPWNVHGLTVDYPWSIAKAHDRINGGIIKDGTGGFDHARIAHRPLPRHGELESDI